MGMYAKKSADPDIQVKAGVGVIIVGNEGNILLERRSDNGMWGLPGGEIEPGENVLDLKILFLPLSNRCIIMGQGSILKYIKE